MSKNINVNPGQYKVAGRERQGEDIDHGREKAAASQNKDALRKQTRRGQKKR